MEEKKFTAEVVENLAEKLLIGLTPEENAMVLEEFEVIDNQFNVFESIPGINEVEPMSWCLDRTIDFLREDELRESVSVEDLLANSDETTDREIETPRVVTE